METPFALELFRTEEAIVTEATLPSNKIHEVYQRHKLNLVERCGYDVANLLPAIEVLGKRASTRRLANFPPIPKHAADIQQLIDNDRFPANLRNIEINGVEENFLLHFQAVGEPPINDEEDTRPTFMVMGTNFFFYLLCSQTHAYGDGTFHVCPAPFTQLFTIHFFVQDRCLPALYIFMNQKSRFLYEHVLQWVINYAGAVTPSLNICWKNFMSDFESGFLPAFRTIFYWVILCGCYFHWCQTIYRKIIEIGLQRLYKDPNSNFKRFIKMLMSLAYLPVNEVHDAFQEIWYNANLFIPDVTEQNLFDQFMRFFLHWMNRINEWNVSQLEHSTNNHIEGWHSHVNIEWGKSRNLWATLKCVQREHKCSAMDYETITSGGTIRKRKASQLRKESQINNLKSNYATRVITRYDFLIKMSNILSGFEVDEESVIEA